MAFYSREEFALAYVVKSQRVGVYRNYIKRLFDIAFVALIAVPVALVVGVLALLIARDGANPFYRQQRVGMDGKIFTMLKLRSMVPNAEAMLESHLESDPVARAEWDERQKLENDPRITRLGRIIRATSLDELPQFWNVLTGEMSVVGPRPMMVDQTSLYPGTAYYYMRPGVTGFWQISERNESSFAERAFHDAHYDSKLTLGTDIRVILRTVSVVVTATGI